MTRPSHEQLLVGGFLVLIANSLYLALSAAPTLLYFTNVALHPILGLVLAAGAVVLRRRLPAMRQSATDRLDGQAPTPRALTVLTLAALALATASGLVLLVLGATRPYRPIVTVHVSSAVLGSALLIGHIWRVFMLRGSARLSRTMGVAAATLVLTVAAVAAAQARRTSDWREQ